MDLEIHDGHVQREANGFLDVLFHWLIDRGVLPMFQVADTLW